MWRTHLAALAVTTCWAWSALADDAYTEVGVLMCTLGEPGQSAASETPSAERTREALCTFMATNGEEETYAGSAEGISISTDRRGTLIWVVRAASGVAEPGALQQIFAADSKTPADQKSPLIGEKNSSVVLHSMADETEGSASAPEKPTPTGFVILKLELTLKSASG
jgi:hypothetical protein